MEVAVTDSIITDVAKGIGLDASDSAFNPDIQVYCGIAALDLEQVGVITNSSILTTTTWVELGYYGSNPKDDLLAYFVLVTKLHFDPPQPSMVQTFKATIDSTLERMRVRARSHELKGVSK